MLREIHIMERGVPGGSKVVRFEMAGHPTDNWQLVTAAMKHNAMIKGMFLQAVLEFCKDEGIDLVDLEKKARLSKM